MAFTVAPLHNISIYPGTQIPFGAGFLLSDVPRWLREDSLLRQLGRRHSDAVQLAQHALIAEYPAAGYGEADPDWKGDGPQSIQNSKYQAALLAGLALWLARPTSAGFTLVFHAISLNTDDVEMPPVIQAVDSHNKVERYNGIQDTLTSLNDVMDAAKLHNALLSIPKKNAVWTATRALWSAITTSAVDLRYLLFWIALEALFGPNEGTEVSFKIAQRISFFTADASKTARENLKVVKECYSMRSKIVHGRWEGDPKMAKAMETTENAARIVFLYLLRHPELMAVFRSRKRDEFLEDWVFSRQIDPPPLANYLGA